MSMNFVLTLQTQPNPGQRFEISGPSLLLGRDPSADIMVEDLEVSRRHARLIAQSSGYAIEDLGSTNGTFVNERPVRSLLPLRPGDQIRLGDQITLRYEAVPAAGEGATSNFPVWQVAPEEPEPLPAAPPVAPPPLPMAQPEAHMAPPPAAAPLPMPQAEEYEPAASRAARRRERRKGLRLPLDKPWVAPVLIVGLLGACALTFFFWYVDANFLWCDVFGGIIPACR